MQPMQHIWVDPTCDNMCTCAPCVHALYARLRVDGVVGKWVFTGASNNEQVRVKIVE